MIIFVKIIKLKVIGVVRWPTSQSARDSNRRIISGFYLPFRLESLAKWEISAKNLSGKVIWNFIDIFQRSLQEMLPIEEQTRGGEATSAGILILFWKSDL